jgi:hypothetical protein
MTLNINPIPAGPLHSESLFCDVSSIVLTYTQPANRANLSLQPFNSRLIWLPDATWKRKRLGPRARLLDLRSMTPQTNVIVLFKTCRSIDVSRPNQYRQLQVFQQNRCPIDVCDYNRLPASAKITCGLLQSRRMLLCHLPPYYFDLLSTCLPSTT